MHLTAVAGFSGFAAGATCGPGWGFAVVALAGVLAFILCGLLAGVRAAFSGFVCFGIFSAPVTRRASKHTTRFDDRRKQESKALG